MNGAVDWDFALKVASRLARRAPFATASPEAALEADFLAFTAQAEGLVAAQTGLPQLAGPARGRVTDRVGWVSANIATFQRLLRPITDRFETHLTGRSALAPIARKAAGAEVGLLLGWMSTRVLGQYDLLVLDDEHPDDQDIVYYVGPNIAALEQRFAFPSSQFRLWIALHECTHRAQFTGVPWLRPHFLGLVNQLLTSVEPDPQRFAAAVKRVTGDVRRGSARLDDGGIAALVATPEQRAVIDRIGGLMSLLEGHGDTIMDRAGANLLPASDRFSRVLKARRQSARGLSRFLQRLIGLDAKLAQYAQGERFIEIVESAGGSELFDRVWRSESWLPTLEEIREPTQWVERVRLSEAVG